MTAPAGDILIDKRTGAVQGASGREAVVLATLKAAAGALAPFEDIGFSHVCKLIRPFATDRAVALRLSDDTQFRFPFADGYWTPLILKNYRYEPELAALLVAVADVDFVFVDCGANFGYWSCQVTSRAFGAHRAIAIEAASTNAALLSANASLNGGRFEVIHAAIGERGGESVALRGAKHESFSIDGANDGPVVETVTTLALDDLLDRPTVANASHIVLKLDVEGMEQAAIRGGRKLLSKDAVVIGEEHGNDPGHAVSRFLADDGFRLFFHDAGRFVELTDLVRQLDAYKTNPRWGYNVFATKSAFWAERLAAVKPSDLSKRNT
ncbi:FkbM family methyltransferase [Chenggangzhangella methanolivorans]|uniref:FkbM family methyltransferase n=1 Tax=Chenggangzhangella methanolivorans TaxID=1437009 RepID=A0A9E6R7V4_9HYPH|nr:FkbM family methyltransferase [Chenggangzhangella methanolivorans]QZN99827.1 FkbM family methyltransferase [Chenggangzhangella methanolivorans]